MAIINTLVGGTDASDGDVYDAADANDTTDKVYKQGVRWSDIRPSPEFGYNIQQIVPATATLWFGLTTNNTDNVEISEDAGLTWTTKAVGHCDDPRMVAVCDTDSTRVILASQSAGGAVETSISIDSGANWTAANTEISCDVGYGGIQFVTPTLAISWGHSAANIVQIGTISGTTLDWSTSTTFAGGGATTFALDMYDDTTGFCMNANHIYKTTDGGDNWVNTGEDTAYAGGLSTRILCLSETVCIITSTNGSIEHYDSATDTVTKKVETSLTTSTGFIGLGLVQIANGNIYAAWAGYDTMMHPLVIMYKSTDSGDTWSRTDFATKQNVLVTRTDTNAYSLNEIGTTNKLIMILPLREPIILDES